MRQDNVMPQRQRGTLHKICLTPGSAHAYVRMNGQLLHLTMMNRGVLQKDKTIAPCTNGDQYHPIDEGAPIALDVTYDAQGKSPLVAAWAPFVQKSGP